MVSSNVFCLTYSRLFLVKESLMKSRSVKAVVALIAILAFTFSSWLFYSKYRLQRAQEKRANQAATPTP